MHGDSLVSKVRASTVSFLGFLLFGEIFLNSYMHGNSSILQMLFPSVAYRIHILVDLLLLVHCIKTPYNIFAAYIVVSVNVAIFCPQHQDAIWLVTLPYSDRIQTFLFVTTRISKSSIHLPLKKVKMQRNNKKWESEIRIFCHFRRFL